MEAVTTHTGTAVALRRSDVDTDQIIPAVYLKRVTRTGFEDGLFAAWRGDENFILNQEPYKAASVLVEGLDDIALTLRHEAEISVFEGNRQTWLPTTDPLPAV